MTLKQFSRAFDAQKIGETKMSIEDGSQYSDLITGTFFPLERERDDSFILLSVQTTGRKGDGQTDGKTDTRKDRRLEAKMLS